MKALLNDWRLIRILRLALGFVVIYEGIDSEDWILTTLGIIFILMPIFKIGCCGVASYNSDISETDVDLDDTTYEEIK